MSRQPIPIPVIGAILTLAVAACSSVGSGASAAASAPASAPASAAAGSGACTTTEEPGTIKAAMDGRAFVPGTISAKVGDVIAFTNGDPVSHSATLDDGSCTTKRLGKGETGALVFTAAGTYPFHCIVHPDMKGTIEITG